MKGSYGNNGRSRNPQAIASVASVCREWLGVDLEKPVRVRFDL